MINVSVYMDFGVVYEYSVADMDKAREHAAAIISTGYRHSTDDALEWFPPHRVLKVKITGLGAAESSAYTDTWRST